MRLEGSLLQYGVAPALHHNAVNAKIGERPAKDGIAVEFENLCNAAQRHRVRAWRIIANSPKLPPALEGV